MEARSGRERARGKGARRGAAASHVGGAGGFLDDPFLEDDLRIGARGHLSPHMPPARHRSIDKGVRGALAGGATDVWEVEVSRRKWGAGARGGRLPARGGRLARGLPRLLLRGDLGIEHEVGQEQQEHCHPESHGYEQRLPPAPPTSHCHHRGRESGGRCRGEGAWGTGGDGPAARVGLALPAPLPRS